MNELQPPDSHHLNAAAGWLDLGDAGDAAVELKQIQSCHQLRSEVVELWWRVHAARKDWTAALESARRLVEAAPEDPAGWINEAFSLHELKRTREAWERLLPVAGRFPEVPTVPYNLACYACQLGERILAWEWLGKAARLMGTDAVKRMARQDLDLAPMREQIESL